jgi:hypothetical protein
MLPPSLLAVPARRAAVAAMLVMGAILAGYVYFLSLYLQKVHHFSPVQTGLGLLPSTLTVVLTSTLVTRRLLTRFGARPVLPAASVAITTGVHGRDQGIAGATFTTGLGAFGVALVALARSPVRSREPLDTPSPAAAPGQPARD